MLAQLSENLPIATPPCDLLSCSAELSKKVLAPHLPKLCFLLTL